MVLGMHKFGKIAFSAILLLVGAISALAGTLTVTTPSSNDVLGLNNTVGFTTSGTFKAVTVTVTLTGAGGTITKTQVFSSIPDTNKLNGSVPLNLTSATAEGDYTLTVSATEEGNSYATVGPLPVRVDVTAPKFDDFAPINGSFVKGTVTVRFNITEANLKNWTVQVNSSDIPNNSGTTLAGTVAWDTSSVTTDGGQSITITATDKGGNTTTKTVNVVVDRVKPVVTVQYPRSDLPISPGSTSSVVIDVQDQTSSSVSVTGVDVVIKTLSGTFLYRVPRISFRSTGSNSFRWSGRIRSTVRLPRSCKLVVTCIDKAGNIAANQEVNLTFGS